MTPTDHTNRPEGSHSRTPERGSARVGRYLVLGTLARGGMGEVLRGRAVGAAGATKEVCIKRIRASRLGERGALELFVREARLSLSLTHANIVSTFDFGRADRDYYLAMEWIDGADLSRIVRDAEAAPLSNACAAHVGAEIARALRYAHDGDASRPSIVHCDVKPSNVLVSRSGDVKLADFGVAVAQLEDSRGGTPRFMAPEVRDGGSAGPPADLYSLGVVLAELLAVTRDATPELRAIAERLVLPAPDARPTAAEVVELLESVVARARAAGATSPRDELGSRAARAAPVLASEPSELLADASYLRDGQSDLETRLTVTTRSTPVPPPTPSPRRSRAYVLAALAIAIAIGIGIGVSQRDVSSEGRLAGAPLERVGEREAVRPEPLPPATPTRVARPRDAPDPVEVVVTEPGPEVRADVVPAEPIHVVRERGPRRVGPAAPAAAPAPSSPQEIEAPPSPAEPAATATLRINAIPWADVELDGRSLGTTPLTHVELAPGPHTLVLTNPVLGRSRTERIEVAAGERRDVIVELR